MLGQTRLSVRQLAALQVGDIIPLEVDEVIELKAEDMPVCRGTLGTANGNYAIKIHEWIRRSKARRLQELVQLTEQGNNPAGGGNLVRAER